MAEQEMISAVASSLNSCSMVSSKKYDVFLSFRGEDTRMNFTSHLYGALKQKRVEAYIDNWLGKGDEISPALMKAIEDSHVSVVIFSKNYASSTWCLAELSKILECRKDQGQIVIPVFYRIDPSDVRKQTGSYKQAFAKHEGEPRCNKWKTALTEVANIPGWCSLTYRTESEFLNVIVGDVLRRLTARYPNQLQGLVGNEENYEHIESLLNIGSSEVRFLGIWGMGGIGKTTLATALYEKLSHQYEGNCFLADVREESKKHGLKALRNKLFSVLLENGNNCFDAPFVVSDSNISRVQHKKCFIVLDDVDTSSQLKKLLKYDFLAPGSRVIVTTRDKHVLVSGQADEIYQVEGLSSHHSLQLFCLTAFGENQPKDGYEYLSNRVLSYCKGIPLALKVLGSSLHSRSKESWESELRKLQKIPNMKIHNILKLSYDGLQSSEKEIFLDIACFFRGWDRGRVTSLLDACDFSPELGIKVLLDKTLITISDANQIEMHDLIQEMGWEIVRQESMKDPGRRSRLWRPEEVLDVLKYNKGTDVVEGIILDLSKLTGDLYLSSNSLAKMTCGRFLQIHGWYGINRFNLYLSNGLQSLSDKLRYLQWDGFCLESLPSNFCAEQLVELRMTHSKLKKLWDGVQNLVNLKTIDLSYSQYLIEIPDLSKAEKLESVSLSWCESLNQLHVHVKSLHVLNLNGCSSIKEFSITSEEMTELDLSDTAICALPSSIGHLSSLKELHLSGTNVESLPANIKNLSMLTRLWLDDCRKLLSLPELPPSLRVFELKDCRKLVSLPELPPSLEKVSAYNCISLKTDITQQLVLQHMLQSHIPYIHKHDDGNYDDEDPEYFYTRYFMFPGDHLTDQCWFRTAESSITIPYLPKSNLFGFIYCIIISKRSSLDVFSCCIYHDGISVGRDGKDMRDRKLISDHVVFWYHDIGKFDGISEVCDHFSNITFIFESEQYYGNKVTHDKERIKGCGVFPVYASESGLNMFGSSSKEIFELESITQISDMSHGQEQLKLEALKMKRKMTGNNFRGESYHK